MVRQLRQGDRFPHGSLMILSPLSMFYKCSLTYSAPLEDRLEEEIFEEIGEEGIESRRSSAQEDHGTERRRTPRYIVRRGHRMRQARRKTKSREGQGTQLEWLLRGIR